MEPHYPPLPTVPLEPLLSVNEVGALLGRSRGFIYKLVNEQELHPIRVGRNLRFAQQDIRDYLEQHREPRP